MSQCCYNISYVYRYIPVRVYTPLVAVYLVAPSAMMIYRRALARARSFDSAATIVSTTTNIVHGLVGGLWRGGGGAKTSYANVRTCSSAHLYVYCILYMHTHKRRKNVKISVLSGHFICAHARVHCI